MMHSKERRARAVFGRDVPEPHRCAHCCVTSALQRLKVEYFLLLPEETLPALDWNLEQSEHSPEDAIPAVSTCWN